MTERYVKDGWQEATWEGNRRRQLRDALQRTVRERLQRLEELAEVNLHFRYMRQQGRFRSSDQGSQRKVSITEASGAHYKPEQSASDDKSQW